MNEKKHNEKIDHLKNKMRTYNTQNRFRFFSIISFYPISKIKINDFILQLLSISAIEMKHVFIFENFVLNEIYNISTKKLISLYEVSFITYQVLHNSIT